MDALGPSRFKIETKQDWCHVCGQRRVTPFADLWRPQNAEHERTPGKNAKYLRVCQDCLRTLASATGLEICMANEQAASS